MIRIGLLSDTHSYLDPQLLKLFDSCDEIWHAGDFGDVAVYDKLKAMKKPLRTVYGNIDGNDLRQMMPASLTWETEGVKIFMTHIGGYPGKYPANIRTALLDSKPGIFICGHSHILKVIYDDKLKLLHLNPGAAGKEGFQLVRTALRFHIDNGKPGGMEVIELGKRNLNQ
jgi:uncharacterized protein